MHFLAEDKAEVGDSGDFKEMTWTVTASEMAKYYKRGSLKITRTCKTKWA